MKPATLGIDPGLKGAIALYDGRSVRVWDMPAVHVKRGGKNKTEVAPALVVQALRDADMLANSLGCEIGRAYLERVGAMPGQGVTSMFSFGRSLGILEGALAGLAVPYDYLSPAEWKRSVGIRDGKDASRLRAQELLPAQAELFARVKDDGRAEAALMAILGYKRMLS